MSAFIATVGLGPGPRFSERRSLGEKQSSYLLSRRRNRVRCCDSVKKEDDNRKYCHESDSKLVGLRMPLGLELEEAPDGSVFVDGIVDGSNAADSGLIEVGDVLVAASIPYGRTLMKCAADGGLDLVENLVRNRREEVMWLEFKEGSGESQMEADVDTPFEEVIDFAKKVFVSEYPVTWPDDEEEKFDVPPVGSPEFTAYMFGERPSSDGVNSTES